MDERKRQMTQWYDRIAPTYDCHRLPLSARLAGALVRQAAISEGEWVIDIGTGTGNVAFAAARCVGPRGHVVGIDLSRAMLTEARRRAGDLPVEFQEMDSEGLQFGEATFDAALAGLLPDIAPAMGEMYRVLRSGGRAAFSTYTGETLQPLADLTWSRLERYRIRCVPAPPESWMASSESEQLLRLLKRAGFQEARVVPEPHTHILQSAEDWWAYMQRSTRWGGLLVQLPEETINDLKAEILADVERLRDGRGIHVDTSALIGIGVRR